MVQLGGVVGHALPALHVESLAIVPGDTLVFATDGVDAAFERDLNGRVPVQPLAQRLLAVHGRGSDDALVLVVRIVGGEP
jgi:negative regulator of sigma-B (phosphoserine phosphatase)